MNARLLLAFLSLSVAGSGCIIVDRDDTGSCCESGPQRPAPIPRAAPGDITFLWTFANVGAGRCADVPDVKSIRITIPGETLHNGGVYACNTAGSDGIQLHDFDPGNYNYTLEALSYQGKVLYQASGGFTVDGDISVRVNLTPPGGGSSFAYVSWVFEGNTNNSNPNCAQAGASAVDVRIDNGKWTRLKCEEGLGDNKISSPYLSPGDHTIEFVGVNITSAGDKPYYYRSGTLTTRANEPVWASFTLLAVGGMSLRWELLDGSIKQTCAQSGVTGIRINMKDRATGKLVYGSDGDPQACDGAPILYRFLRPGQYEVYVRGLNGNRVTYSNENNAPTLTVTAFLQKTEADAITTNLQRQY